MKKKSWLLASAFVALASLFMQSCDDDFNSIGSDMVDEDYMDFDKYSSTDIESGYFHSGAVATNNLAVNTLGSYTNPILGQSQYHYATQLSLDEYAPTIGNNPQIDSVFLYVPYFSKFVSNNSNGQKEYKLDSIYGGEGKFDLKIYENGYYIGAIDPNSETGARTYYSDDNTLFDSQKIGSPLNSSSVSSQNTEFSFNKNEIYLFKKNEQGELVDSEGNVLPNDADFEDKVVKETFAPGMWLDLNTAFFQQKILNTASSNLENQAAFINYFRGLYFNVSQSGSDAGALATMDFTKGYIQINYKADSEADATIRESKTLKINLTGQTINLIENQYTIPQQSVENLYVVGGGKGSNSSSSDAYVSYIDVFGADLDANGIPDKLDYLTDQNWLINEANVTIYVDRAAVGANNPEPERLFLYDLNNSSVLVDYSNDTSTNTSDTKKNKGIYNGILVSQDGQGLYYKFRITEYVKALIASQTPISDTTNKYRLGLAVTESIGLSTFSNLRSDANPFAVKNIPTATVMSPLGTILHSAATTAADKKIKFEIYYTTPN